MKIKHILVAILLPIAAMVSAQQRIEIINQFSKLELNGDMTVELIQADECNVTGIMTSGLITRKVKWKQQNDKLIINVPSGIMDKADSIHLVIKVGTLTHLQTKGATVICKNALTSEYINIDATNAQNKLDLKIDVTEIVLETSNDCHVAVEGKAKWATLITNMGSKIDAKFATFQECTATATFGSEIIANVTSHLKAKTNYKSTVYYLGDPVLNIKKRTASDIVKVEIK